MKGRQTTDLFLIAHETLHSMNSSKSKKGWAILKLDIQKAFDTISWSFITAMLKAFNLPSQWVQLINGCFSNMECTPILNGSKITSFKPTRGIRQGDPLSPYLFIMAMEYLSILITDAINKKLWKPFTLRNNSLEISHLFFADDVLFFAKADDLSLNQINSVIKDFCEVSGMEINLEKSKVWLSPGILNNRKNYISNLL